MHGEVQASPFFLDGIGQSFNLAVVVDVAGEDQLGAETFGQGIDAFEQSIVEIGKRQFGAFAVSGLSDAPGNGTVVGQADDQAFFIFQPD